MLAFFFFSFTDGPLHGSLFGWYTFPLPILMAFIINSQKMKFLIKTTRPWSTVCTVLKPYLWKVPISPVHSYGRKHKPETFYHFLSPVCPENMCVCHWHKWADLCSQRFSSSLPVLFELLSFKLNIVKLLPKYQTCTKLWASTFLFRWIWESIKSVTLCGSIKRKLRAEVWLLHQITNTAPLCFEKAHCSMSQTGSEVKLL